ncbi:MAG: DUF1080 domain-containing protein [Pirellulaceae bacterium]|nr:DUF1080 domain-containing protein [Pirellulaceae bacterium]
MLKSLSAPISQQHGFLSVLVFALCTQFVLAEIPERGSFEGDQLPEDAPQLWTQRNGSAKQMVKDDNWIVRQPDNFLRGIDWGHRQRSVGQRGDVEIRWATDSENNHSADGLRIVTQGRAFRIHPLHVPDGQDQMLVGTPSGMYPQLFACHVDLTKLPDFDATQLNTYRVSWETNAEDDFLFELSINGTSIGMFHGEPCQPDARHMISLEFRTGEQTIDFLRWNLFQGGQPIVYAPPLLDHHAQLLFDDHLVEQYEGLKRTVHQPDMHPANPVLTWEEPWEYAAVLLWGTVIYDEQENLFKMWYMTWGSREHALLGHRTPMCYATSVDGIHWKRPQFTHCHFQLKNPDDPDGPPLDYPVNNIVLNITESDHGMDSPTVVKDLHDPDPNCRYKMSCWHRLPTGTGIFHFHSPDGIHWTLIPKMVVKSGDRNTFHWDPFSHKWIVVTRPHGSLYALEEFGQFNNNLIRASISMEPADREPPTESTDIYSCPVFNYEGMQIAVPELYGRKTTNRWISYLAWSHNGRHWTRDPDRVPWMPWSDRPGDFDCWRRNIHNGGVIRRGDKLWIYFSGRSQGKPVPGKSGFLVPSGEPGWDSRGIIGSIGIGILRVDGFCSRDAGPTGGSLRTRPFQFAGTQLQINAEVKDGGAVRVALVDESGEPLEGFRRDQCDPTTGDSIAHVISWEGRTDLSKLRGKLVRLEMSLKNADLYSFRFTDPDINEKGFVSLFNGQDLDGWQIMGDPAGWEVTDGVIRSESKKGANWIRFREQYDDFVLKLDWRVSPGGNSGVFIRAVEGGQPWIDGYEVQISNMDQDSLHCTGSLYSAVPVLNRPDESPDTWHTYEIRCQGSHLMVFSDGVTCVDIDQAKLEKIQGRPLRGFIGLQGGHHQDAGHYIEYRNIRIRPL